MGHERHACTMARAAVRAQDACERARVERWAAAQQVLDDWDVVHPEAALRAVLKAINLDPDLLGRPVWLCDEQTVVVVFNLPRYDEVEARVFRSLDSARHWWLNVAAWDDDTYELLGVCNFLGGRIPVRAIGEIGCDLPPERLVKITAAHPLKIPADRTGGITDVHLWPGDTVEVLESYTARLDRDRRLVRTQ